VSICAYMRSPGHVLKGAIGPKGRRGDIAVRAVGGEHERGVWAPGRLMVRSAVQPLLGLEDESHDRLHDLQPERHRRERLRRHGPVRTRAAPTPIHALMSRAGSRRRRTFPRSTRTASSRRASATQSTGSNTCPASTPACVASPSVCKARLADRDRAPCSTSPGSRTTRRRGRSRPLRWAVTRASASPSGRSRWRCVCAPLLTHT
jgi:hypothetical protein